jgi:NAD+ synthase (glutamine-hydrolysing)
LSASNEVVGKKEFREDLVKMLSARLCAAYAYADAGDGESTTDLVFGSHNIIAENGKILCESPLFQMKDATADIDVEKTPLRAEEDDHLPQRRGSKLSKRLFLFASSENGKSTVTIPPIPFIPEGEGNGSRTGVLVMKMQAMGLVKRLQTVHQKKRSSALVGVWIRPWPS